MLTLGNLGDSKIFYSAGELEKRIRCLVIGSILSKLSERISSIEGLVADKHINPELSDKSKKEGGKCG